MASFFDHPFYKWNKLLLSVLGTWPEQSLFSRCLFPFLAWATLMSVMIPEAMRIPGLRIVFYWTCFPGGGTIFFSTEIVSLATDFVSGLTKFKTYYDSFYRVIRLTEVRNDVDTLMDCIPPLLVMFMGYAQLFSSCYKREAILKMMEKIETDWKTRETTPDGEIIGKYAHRGYSITVFYMALMFSSMIIYLVSPVLPVFMDFIVPLNETRRKNYLFEAEYFVESDGHYWPILSHSYLTSVIAIWILVANDAMFFMLVEHACGLFETTGANLKVLNKKLTEDGGVVDEHAIRIVSCASELHKQAIEFAECIGDTYYFPLSFVFGTSILVLSITGVQTIIHLNETEEALRYGSFSIAQTLHLYFNSVPGQKIIDYSSAVFDDACSIDWFGLTTKTQKLLIMPMMRSLKPCQITAGKIYVVSMENYSAVMQTSMSYFTVLSSMR